ncbi:hypothetical protein ACVXHB_26400 [Escherichia coli]
MPTHRAVLPFSAAVRGDRGGQVTGDVVFIPPSWPCVSSRQLTVHGCRMRGTDSALLAVHHRHLTKTVMVITGYGKPEHQVKLSN